MRPSLRCLAFFSLLYLLGCEKTVETPTPLPQEKFVTVGNRVVSSKTSTDFKSHFLQIDTLTHTPYTLYGYGDFGGQRRIVSFSGASGLNKEFRTIRMSGWDDFGDTFLARDTTGAVIELFRKEYGTANLAMLVPVSVFAPKSVTPASSWDSFSGLQRGRNTFHPAFHTKVISHNATTSTGIPGCVMLEYRASDYIDTIFFQPAKGPVEIRSWRFQFLWTGQEAVGGFKTTF